ncbi:hypothetical protein TNCV_4361781, partial [Trichonephila clavipes]
DYHTHHQTFCAFCGGFKPSTALSTPVSTPPGWSRQHRSQIHHLKGADNIFVDFTQIHLSINTSARSTSVVETSLHPYQWPTDQSDNIFRFYQIHLWSRQQIISP